MADVPAGIPYGEIQGLFVRFLADSDDAGDTPDASPLTGSVKIEPLVPVVRWPSLVPPRIAANDNLVCPLNSDGELCAPGTTTAGVRVVASEQPLGNPSLIQYRATFNLTNVRTQPNPVVFSVPAGGVVNLTTVLPETAEPGTIQILVNADSKQDKATLDADVAAVLGDAGSDSATLLNATIGAEITAAVALKADDAATTAALALKATTAALADEVAAREALSTALAAKADLVGGMVPTSQIPAVAFTNGQAVTSRSALLALAAQPGDIGVITTGGDKGSYILKEGGVASVWSDWLLMNAPTDVVGSVNGQTGTVVLGAADVGAAPATRTINGHALTADVTLTKDDIGLTGVEAALAACAVGPTAPTVPTSQSVLWVDTSAGYSVLKIVTGD